MVKKRTICDDFGDCLWHWVNHIEAIFSWISPQTAVFLGMRFNHTHNVGAPQFFQLVQKITQNHTKSHT